jgi:hypothetical protein
MPTLHLSHIILQDLQIQVNMKTKTFLHLRLQFQITVTVGLSHRCPMRMT